MMESSIDWTVWAAGFAFVFGAIWGSFFNVVIYRLPLGLSLSRPGSHCPSCERPVRFRHNVPVLGWLMLRGKCADCKTPVSARYPVVEFATGLLSAAVWLLVARRGGDLIALEPIALVAPYLFLFCFVGLLVVITFIDLDYSIIPHPLTLTGIGTGLLASFLIEPISGVSWVDSTLGALIGGGTILVIIQTYFLVRGREGMGGGDFMMMAMLGAWLGYESLLFILLGSSVQGLIAVGLILLVGRSEGSGVGALAPPEELGSDGAGEESESQDGQPLQIPFGPFLALSALEWLFFSDWLREVVYGLYQIP